MARFCTQRSVLGTSGDGVVSRVTATHFDGNLPVKAEAVVDVPQVAVVDRVVVVAEGLGARVALDLAALLVDVELEHLVVSVLLVLGQAGRPDVLALVPLVAIKLLLDRIDTARRALGVIVSLSDFGDHGVVHVLALLKIELSLDMAVSVEGIVVRELGLVGAGDSSHSCEGGKSFHLELRDRF